MSPFEKDAGGILTKVLTKNVIVWTKIVSRPHSLCFSGFYSLNPFLFPKKYNKLK